MELLRPIPRANALAERVIGTLRRDCVDHVIPLNERHLRTVLAEYVDYYNTERPHRTLRLAPPRPPPPPGRAPPRRYRCGDRTAGPRGPPPHLRVGRLSTGEVLPSHNSS